MLKKGDRVLVAVSGGPDSVFLLYVLYKLKRLLDIKLYIAHMDHGVRGQESRRDAVFVKNLAKTLGIKLIFKALSEKQTKSNLSPEERLREKRYAFFKNAAAKSKLTLVATAHTLDDQAETVLMRVIKGATLKGIVGIHPVRAGRTLRFIRPLIEIEKRDILRYLKNKNISFRIDRTNLEDKFLRNRVRNKVFPYLEKINPRIKRSLFNLAGALREDFEFIEEEKRRKATLIKTKRREKYVLLSDILLQSKALQREIVREALKAVGGNIKKLTFRHWKDVDFFIRTKKTGKSMDLPGGIKIRKARERITFAK